MSDQQDLLQLLDEIRAVPKAALQECRTPIGIYLGEVERLHTRALLDLPQLKAAGMPAELPDRMLLYASALRTAQSNWKEQSSELKKARKEWKEKAAEMYALRSDLIENMNFAYRKQENLLQKLADIKQGRAHADAIQDLANLAVLGRENAAPLLAINYDLSQFDRAAEMADEMAGVLAAVNGRMSSDDQKKMIRDQAFTLLKAVVDEVRDFGKFVFRKDAERFKSYTSQYKRKLNQEYRKKQGNPTKE